MYLYIYIFIFIYKAMSIYIYTCIFTNIYIFVYSLYNAYIYICTTKYYIDYCGLYYMGFYFHAWWPFEVQQVHTFRFRPPWLAPFRPRPKSRCPSSAFAHTLARWKSTSASQVSGTSLGSVSSVDAPINSTPRSYVSARAR